MENDRGAMIQIGNREYEMLLTTRATKEIAKRYGGLEHLGDKLMKAENFELALDEVVWLITLLANQSILVHNLLEPDDKRGLYRRDHIGRIRAVGRLAASANDARPKTNGEARCDPRKGIEARHEDAGREFIAFARNGYRRGTR